MTVKVDKLTGCYYQLATLPVGPASIQLISASLAVRPDDLLPVVNAFLHVPPAHSLPTRLFVEHATETVPLVRARNSTNARRARPTGPYSRMVDVYLHVPEGSSSTRLRVVARAAIAAVMPAPRRDLTNV
jgi:hypothetical protein